MLVEHTGREGMNYKLIDRIYWRWRKIMNYIKRGHLIRQGAIRQYQRSHKIFQLHLGCGQMILQGFLNSDVLGPAPIDITKRLPLSDGTVDLIFSYHLIEHIYQRQSQYFLGEAVRVLKTNGVMIVGTPSLAKMCQVLYCPSDNNQKHILLNYYRKFYPARIEPLTPAQFLNDSMHILFGHEYLYDLALLQEMGYAAGFKEVTVLDPREADREKIYSLPKRDTFRDIQSELFRFKK